MLLLLCLSQNPTDVCHHQLISEYREMLKQVQHDFDILKFHLTKILQYVMNPRHLRDLREMFLHQLPVQIKVARVVDLHMREITDAHIVLIRSFHQYFIIHIRTIELRAPYKIIVLFPVE